MHVHVHDISKTLLIGGWGRLGGVKEEGFSGRFQVVAWDPIGKRPKG